MLGFSEAMLGHMKAVAQNNYSGTKIRPSGFVRALLDNNPNLEVSTIDGVTLKGMKLSSPDGHIKDVRIKYLPRLTADQVGSEDNCDNDILFQYAETTLAAPKVAKLGFYLDWGFLERYSKEATALTSTGNPSTPVLMEFLTQLAHTANALIGKVDNDLLSDVVWGKNAVTGLNTVKTINFNKDSSVFDLSAGLTELISDAQANEIADDLILVGNGNMNRFEISKGSISTAQNGVNAAGLGGYKWYHDLRSTSKWGANQVGVFAKGNVGFVDIDKYIAWKTGRHGTSEFLQIQLPINTPKEGEPVKYMTFNVQIKEIDCPTEVFDGYTTRVVNRGYQVFLTKNYGLFQMPDDTYRSSDALSGVNGALRYEFTNDCDPCPAA